MSIATVQPLSAPMSPRRGGTFRDPITPPPLSEIISSPPTASSPNLKLLDPYPPITSLSKDPLADLGLIPMTTPTTSAAAAELLLRQKRETEKLKQENQASMESREIAYLLAQKELESLKVKQDIAAAELAQRKRECEDELERLRQAQKFSEIQMAQLKAEREITRKAEEETARKLNERLAQLEMKRDYTKLKEMEELNRKIRDQTLRQTELASDKIVISHGRRLNEVQRMEHEHLLRSKDTELKEREMRLLQEWEDIERRRLALERLEQDATPLPYIGGTNVGTSSLNVSRSPLLQEISIVENPDLSGGLSSTQLLRSENQKLREHVERYERVTVVSNHDSEPSRRVLMSTNPSTSASPSQ
eukprot:NODE_3205_length_1400_cov_32.220047_g2786_i0.p1 GENE.NODE_3205_length_1400_cov_32.220047_g2786_i0~~NODE_3205_length_1400_cov_32.220047_g2786_i0.p1  ORF type:complete len:405 (-),score=95.51 NODE_3205_length_1400_cov_32.220047_g2786_i0:184-1269(-)